MQKIIILSSFIIIYKVIIYNNNFNLKSKKNKKLN